MTDYGTMGYNAVSIPPAMQAYKRGVLKAAPKEFTVTPLPPAKHGNAYSYGMRITPIRSDNTSILSDRSWNSDYEIWRRWEDCLYFQEMIEEEYAQMSRDKRKRLKSGKGVKKDGVYKTSDFAASFESLPPGPDYHDVALDVHSYLPRLNKKGTLFRPSVAVIQQRGREFESMIMALWQEDCPTLFKELRELSQIRDFFGYWQRDDDRLRKSGISVAGGNLYGTAAASTSAVSLVPTLASARTTASSAMFLRMRGHEEPIGQLPIITDDDFSVLNVIPPYSPSATSTRQPPTPKSPKSFRSTMSKRPRTSAGEISLHSVDSRRSTQPGSPNPSSMKFVLEPSGSRAPEPRAAPQETSKRTTPVTSEAPRHRPPDLNLQPSRMGGSSSLVPVQEHQPPPSYSHGLPSPPQSPPRMTITRPGTSPGRDNRNFRVHPSASDEPTGTQGFIVSPDLHIPVPRFPPRSTQVHGQDPAPKIASTSRQTPSPTGSSSPPPSATRSLESAASDNSPSVFSEDDSSSSKRTSWESQNSNSDGSTARKEQRGPPTSYDRFKPSHRTDGSASSVDTIYGRHSSRLSASTPPSQLHRTSTPSSAVDLLDTYFDNLTICRSDSPTTSMAPRPHSVAPSFISETDTVTSRESISFTMPTSDRFPAPFQHRPPGQFHIPWSPSQQTSHSITPPTLSPSVSMLSLDPNTSFTIKAMHGESIVSFKVERNISLAELRQRIREKFVNQEKVPLNNNFVVSYKNLRSPGRIGNRARTYSTSTIATVSTIASLGSLDPSSLSFLVLEPEWRSLAEQCGSKLTLVVLDA